MRRVLAAALLLAAASAAQAHGFDERYDLPVPLAWVVAGACAVVALSFVAVAVLGARGARGAPGRAGRAVVTVELPPALRRVLRGAAWVLFVLTVASALWGTRDPLMNLAPTLVWIVWWLGMGYASALLGGVWTLLDPWRSSFDVLTELARRLGLCRHPPPRWRWPAALGQWPAAALLLLWCWLEVVVPLASTPFKLGLAAVAWTLLSLAGMAAFGRAAWQTHADVFAVVFATLSRLAPLRLRGSDGEAGAGNAPAGHQALVMAMLSSVVFDGVHGGAAWTLLEAALRRLAPDALDVNGVVAGSVGLLLVWSLFGAAWRIGWSACRPLLGPHRLAPSRLVQALVPIALGYTVAHNLSSFVVQGQRVFALLSDPFGRQWDLLGTARWYPDIGLMDARLTWFVAVAAIVAGHVASIVASHRAVLAAGVPPRRAAVGLLPMTLLMLALTALSLTLIGEPMIVQR